LPKQRVIRYWRRRRRLLEGERSPATLFGLNLAAGVVIDLGQPVEGLCQPSPRWAINWIRLDLGDVRTGVLDAALGVRDLSESKERAWFRTAKGEDAAEHI